MSSRSSFLPSWAPNSFSHYVKMPHVQSMVSYSQISVWLSCAYYLTCLIISLDICSRRYLLSNHRVCRWASQAQGERHEPMLTINLSRNWNRIKRNSCVERFIFIFHQLSKRPCGRIFFCNLYVLNCWISVGIAVLLSFRLFYLYLCGWIVHELLYCD